MWEFHGWFLGTFLMFSLQIESITALNNVKENVSSIFFFIFLLINSGTQEVLFKHSFDNETRLFFKIPKNNFKLKFSCVFVFKNNPFFMLCSTGE